MVYSSTQSPIREKPESLPTLKKILAILWELPDLKFSIEGHIDNQGTKGLNEPLSQRRAKAVELWLIREGISSRRLQSKGWGDTKPIDTNETPRVGQITEGRIPQDRIISMIRSFLRLQRGRLFQTISAVAAMMTCYNEPGLQYLCEGYRKFLLQARKYCRALIQLVENGFPASHIMDAMAWPLVIQQINQDC